ncbi:hypothetical protein B7489_23235 [Vibrio alginolyticus]|nr:hypothetical protein B7489_23235 [Vibrio alginolyticus]
MKERAPVTHLNAGRGQLVTGATPSLRHGLIITYSFKNTTSLQALMIKQTHHSLAYVARTFFSHFVDTVLKHLKHFLTALISSKAIIKRVTTTSNSESIITLSEFIFLSSLVLIDMQTLSTSLEFTQLSHEEVKKLHERDVYPKLNDNPPLFVASLIMWVLM